MATAIQCLCKLCVGERLNQFQGSQSLLMAVQLGTVTGIVALCMCKPCITELLRRPVLHSWTHDSSVTVLSHLYFPLLFLKTEVMEAGKITELCRIKSRVAKRFLVD